MANFTKLLLPLLVFLDFSPLWSLEDPTPFSCPHQCGEWGSKSIQEIEWGFTHLLYQADVMSHFLTRNSKPHRSEVLCTPPKEGFKYQKFTGFDSSWYHAMTRAASEGDGRLVISDEDSLCNSYNVDIIVIPDLETGDDSDEDDSGSYCKGTRAFFWGIQPENHQKKIFVKREFNRVELLEDEDWEEYCGWDYYSSETKAQRPYLETLFRLDNLIDFKQACFDLDEELIWLREDVHRLHEPIAQKEQVREISDAQYQEFLTQFRQLTENYSKIFSTCAEEHNAPSAFYHMAIEYFNEGDHTRGIDCVQNVLDRTDLNTLEAHLASNICFSQGWIQNEVALYDQALFSLKEALDHEAENKQAYFEKALVLFEQGRFEESVENYLLSEYSIQTLDLKKTSLVDLAFGFTEGILSGAEHSLTDFIPSMCSSLYGLSNGLWAFVCSPLEVSQNMVNAVQALAQFLDSHSTLEVFQTLIPELKEFAALEKDQSQERGKVIGTILGKYGTECLTLFGSAKALKIYRELKAANGALTLNTLAQVEKAEKLQAISTQWWKSTAPVIEEIKVNGGRIGENLYKAFRNQNLSELQLRRILHQAGYKTFPRPKGIPEGWATQISKNGGGMRYQLGALDKVGDMTLKVEVRVMPGNPSAKWPSQRRPYAKHSVDGKYLDKYGNTVPKEAAEAHIPLDEYNFEKTIKTMNYE
ncbi:MAG: hypothetical protein K940chlam2_01226 [Chlamydiae bacterium]|nr:hypothetical protein [Chlamydiota bacterium]